MTFDRVFASNNLLRVGFDQAVDGGPGRGVDGISLRDMTPVEMARIARKLSPCIGEGQFIADVARLQPIPKGNGEFRPIRIPTGTDRWIASALVEALTPSCEQMFVPQSHGFRPGRSHLTTLAALIRAMDQHQCYIVAADDMRKAFDSVPVGQVIEAHRRAFRNRRVFCWPKADGERFLQLITQVLTAGKPKQKRGILQGCNYSPLAMNVFLHFYYDVPLTKTFSGSWFRYVDNIVCAARDPVEGQEFLDKSSRLLAKCGITLHEDENRIADLANTSICVMGLILSRGEEHLSISLAPEAWTDLEEKLGKSHHYVNPPLQALGTLRGWIGAYGPALEPAELTLAHLSLLMERQGFPSVLKLEEAQEWVQRSISRWHSCLRQVMNDK